jgi:hypothetical protein
MHLPLNRWPMVAAALTQALPATKTVANNFYVEMAGGLFRQNKLAQPGYLQTIT